MFHIDFQVVAKGQGQKLLVFVQMFFSKYLKTILLDSY